MAFISFTYSSICQHFRAIFVLWVNVLAFFQWFYITTVVLPALAVLLLLSGLSLRGGDRGFPLATMSVAPGYLHRKIEEI